MDEYPFKIRDDSGVVLTYITCTYSSFTEFQELVVKSVGRKASLSFEDDEGDLVAIECDRDLKEAVLMARRRGKGKVVVCMSGKSKDAGVPLPMPVLIGVGVGVGLVFGYLLKRGLNS